MGFTTISTLWSFSAGEALMSFFCTLKTNQVTSALSLSVAELLTLKAAHRVGDVCADFSFVQTNLDGFGDSRCVEI